jgi:hypothetical protein
MGKPNKKPAQGVVNTPNPPRPPAKSGNPRATKDINSKTAKAPLLEPNITPHNITPRLWAVIGIPLTNVSFGSRPNAAINPANNAI